MSRRDRGSVSQYSFPIEVFMPRIHAHDMLQRQLKRKETVLLSPLDVILTLAKPYLLTVLNDGTSTESETNEERQK